MLPAAVAATSVGLAADLDSMKVALRTIAADAAKSGEPISADVKAVVRDMLDKIEAQVVEALDCDHEIAQDSLDEAWQVIEDCKTARDSDFAGAVADATAAASDSSTDFHECKTGEPVVILGADLLQKRKAGQAPDWGATTHDETDFGYDSSREWKNDTHWSETSHEKHAHDEEEELCTLLNNTVKGFDAKVEKQNDAAYCEPVHPGECGDGEYAFYKKVETSYDWFNHMDEFEKDHAADYKKKRSDCHTARQRHIERRAECSRLQEIFEDKTCAEANLIDEKCHSYKTCYDDAVDLWEKVNTTVAAKEVQFKLQQHALEILQCYGDQILKDVTDLSECNTAAEECVRCPELDISYVPPHDFCPCEEAKGDYRPCGEEWHLAVYGKYYDSDTPICPCTACAAPAI